MADRSPTRSEPTGAGRASASDRALLVTRPGVWSEVVVEPNTSRLAPRTADRFLQATSHPLATGLPPAGLGVSDRQILDVVAGAGFEGCTSSPRPIDDPTRLEVSCGGLALTATLVGRDGSGLADLTTVNLLVTRPAAQLVAREDLLFATLEVTAPQEAHVWLRALIDAGPDGAGIVRGERRFRNVDVVFMTPLAAPDHWHFEFLLIRGVAD